MIAHDLVEVPSKTSLPDAETIQPQNMVRQSAGDGRIDLACFIDVEQLAGGLVVVIFVVIEPRIRRGRQKGNESECGGKCGTMSSDTQTG